MDKCQQVLNFWFRELEPRMWWEKNEDIDTEIATWFSVLHQQARQESNHPIFN